MPGYDFIGDVHGQYGALCALLEKMGYTKSDGVYRHPDRIAVFVGDIVDRGPDVRQTLYMARRMCESGAAFAVMGNHEFNLICFLTRDHGGTWLREHSGKNRDQVQATLDSFKGHERELDEYKEWMLSLPLFLELRRIRVVHACWDHISISRFWCSEGRLNPETLRQAALDKGSPVGQAVEILLKGREIQLPDGISFTDINNVIRTRKRMKWWIDPSKHTFGELLVLPMYNCQGNPDLLDQVPVFENGYPPFYAPDEEPVVFGHYWLRGEPRVLQRNILCTDYGAGAGELLTAYRWSGEEYFTDQNWVSVSVSSSG